MSKEGLLNAAEIYAETATERLLRSSVGDVREALSECIKNAYMAGYRASDAESNDDCIDNLTM